MKKKGFFGDLWDGIKSVGSAIVDGVKSFTGLGQEGPPINKDSPNIFMMPVMNPMQTSNTLISPVGGTELDKPSSYPTVSPMIQINQENAAELNGEKEKEKEKEEDDKKDDDKKDDDKKEKQESEGIVKGGKRKMKKEDHHRHQHMGYIKAVVNEDSESAVHHHHKQHKH